MVFTKNKHETPIASQTFLDHIQELRRRLFIVAFVFIVGGFIGYALHNQIINLLKRPFTETLYFGTPAGGFNFVMKICVLTGVMIVIPVFIYNLISFIQPALKEEMLRKSVRRMTILSAVLATGGMLFAYLFIVPMSLHFFQGFKVAGVQPLITADSYLSFVINCLLSFTVIFQIPLLMTFIDRIKPMPPKQLLKYEKYVIVGALAIALILPFTYDPLTQFVVAIPIIVLYNMSIVLIMLAHRRQRKSAKAEFPIFAPPLQPQLQTSVPTSVSTYKPLSPAPKLRLIQDISAKTKLNYEI